MTVTATPRGAEQLELRTADGVRLDAWRCRVDARPDAAVVLIHGFVGRARSPALDAHAEALVADGRDVLVYDGRGHGDSGGACTLGTLEQHDVAAAVEAASDRADRVVVVGESMGGIAALRAAVHGLGIDGVVTIGTPSFWRLTPNVRTIAAALVTQTAVGRLVAERAFGVRIADRTTRQQPPAHLAARLAVPYAVLQGSDDRFMPTRNARELHAHAGGPTCLDVVDGMGHGFGPESVEPVRRAVTWVLSAW